eukprot:scaffold249043_cov28-Prasinocladus_malaysianus.AAC.1
MQVSCRKLKASGTSTDTWLPARAGRPLTIRLDSYKLMHAMALGRRPESKGSIWAENFVSLLVVATQLTAVTLWLSSPGPAGNKSHGIWWQTSTGTVLLFKFRFCTRTGMSSADDCRLQTSYGTPYRTLRSRTPYRYRRSVQTLRSVGTVRKAFNPTSDDYSTNTVAQQIYE